MRNRIIVGLAALVTGIGLVAVPSGPAVAVTQPVTQTAGAPVYTPPARLPWGDLAQPQPARKVAAPTTAQAARNLTAPKGMPKAAGATKASLTGNTFFYNTAQSGPPTGTLGVASSGVASTPALSGAAHSLGEIAVMKDASSATKATVEIGWTVDTGLNGDSAPHLFCYWWKNNVGQGYNGGSGFVPWSSPSATCGQSLATSVGTLTRYGIVHDGSAWWLAYNNGWVGYYPDYLWSSTAYGVSGSNTPAITFVNTTFFQVFGEIAYVGTQAASTACADMGNGALGTSTSPLPARWASTQYNLGGTYTNATLLDTGSPYPSQWLGYLITPMSFRFGGFGAC